jgi:hypothetical protein
MGTPYNNRRQIESLKKSNTQRIEEQNKRLNLSVAGAEKLGVSGSETVQTFSEIWEVIDPKESQEIKDKRSVNRGYTIKTAPTINPSRPRAMKIGYSREDQTLVVKFRGPVGAENNGAWCAYPDIPLTMWVQLKASNSTGRYLRHSGIDNASYYYMNPSDLPENVRVLFNS